MTAKAAMAASGASAGAGAAVAATRAAATALSATTVPAAAQQLRQPAGHADHGLPIADADWRREAAR